MKLLIFLFFFITTLYGNGDKWNIESISFSMENDDDVKTDARYTHGSSISILYARKDYNQSKIHIPFTNIKNKEHFISFAFANQMYNPEDQSIPYLIEDDRPYAGWSYIEVALHQVTKRNLDSLSMQIGIVGPSSGMEALQKKFHEYIGAGYSAGWDNQLKNEIGVQINYIHKWRYELDNIAGAQSEIIPYAGANLGNISIKANAGALYRIGWNIPKDYGMNSLVERSYPAIPLHSKSKFMEQTNWSLYFNIEAGANVVGRDIFLDGNTFKSSHSIDKNYLNAYIGGGASLRYKNFLIDYMHHYYTKEYNQRGNYKEYKGYGSLIFTYNFN